MGEEHLQQGELRAGELHLPGAAHHFAGGGVHAQVAEGEHVVLAVPGVGRGGVGAAAQQRADAGQQFVELEGFDEVVVGAGVEAGDPVADGVAGGEHQDRHGDLVGAQPPGGGQSVHAGHEDVEDDQLGVVAGDLLDGVEAVHGELGAVSLEGEAAAERFADGRLVVDDEDAGGLVAVFGGGHRVTSRGDKGGLTGRSQASHDVRVSQRQSTAVSVSCCRRAAWRGPP